MNLRTIIATLGVLLTSAAPALAQITYVSQARSASASRTGFTPQSFTAPGFGPFVASASAGGAFGQQNSTLNPASIAWTGSGGYAGGSPPGSGSSEFDVTFDIVRTMEFAWSGATSGLSAPVVRRLTGPGTDITLAFDGPAATGLLQPGRYRLQYSCCCLTGGSSTFSVAPHFTIDWFSIDGGGARGSAGSLTLSGTAGQWDAAATVSDGRWDLTSGFWSVTEIPASDTCSQAKRVAVGTYFGGTGAASNDGSNDCGTSSTTPDVWYAFTAPVAGTLTADTCGSSYDTVLSVHTGCPGSSANQLACNDDFCDLQSQVSAALTTGQTCLIRVSGFNGSTGRYTLHLAFSSCRPDFNHDGNLDPDDLGDFITCYFTEPPCPGADFNADTNIDPDDLGDFITAYFQGC